MLFLSVAAFSCSMDFLVLCNYFLRIMISYFSDSDFWPFLCVALVRAAEEASHDKSESAEIHLTHSALHSELARRIVLRDPPSE